jgi:hypothetical protein
MIAGEIWHIVDILTLSKNNESYKTTATYPQLSSTSFNLTPWNTLDHCCGGQPF